MTSIIKIDAQDAPDGEARYYMFGGDEGCGFVVDRQKAHRFATPEDAWEFVHQMDAPQELLSVEFA